MAWMTTPLPRPGRHPRCGATAAMLLLAGGAGLLAGCQTTPAPEREVWGEVVSVPRTRAALTQGASHAHLHAAVLAGASPHDAAAERLVTASCAMPDQRSAGPHGHTVRARRDQAGGLLPVSPAAGLARSRAKSHGRDRRQTRSARSRRRLTLPPWQGQQSGIDNPRSKRCKSSA